MAALGAKYLATKDDLAQVLANLCLTRDLVESVHVHIVTSLVWTCTNWFRLPLVDFMRSLDYITLDPAGVFCFPGSMEFEDRR